MRFHLLALFLLLIPPHAGAQDRALTPLSTIPQLFARGYEALKIGPREALPVFEEIVRRDSTNVTALRQLGSIYVNLEQKTEALRMFEASQHILPSDTTRLQIAYLQNALGNNSKALALFGTLSRSRDPQIAATARRAIDILTPLYCWERGAWWTRALGSVHYDHRFEDVIASLSLQEGREILGDRVLSVYGDITLNKDTRSTGGLQPVIYSDNYFLGAIGLRLQPTRWWSLDIQPGFTVDLLDRPGKERVDFDYRMLTTLGGGISAAVDVPPTLQVPCAPFADAFLSTGYYSRYKNVIGYSQVRAGFRTLAYRHTALDLYARGDFTFDALSSHREFYNNTLEGSLGARIVPDHRWGINLLVEFHRGYIWMDPSYGAGQSRWYSSFRVLLVIDRYLCL
jgi:tetratricopeptide (TPR) repeat protein